MSKILTWFVDDKPSNSRTEYPNSFIPNVVNTQVANTQNIWNTQLQMMYIYDNIIIIRWYYINHTHTI